ncbi:hypothetical protein AHAS_Ahas17G0186400 [Arachis hypogaea]
MRVLKIRVISFEEASSEARNNGDLDCEEIVNDICAVETDWVRDSKRMPRYIRREDLIPEAKGWFAIVRRSILSTSNNSEVNINRAIIVHCIMKGGKIKVPEIIANNIKT